MAKGQAAARADNEGGAQQRHRHGHHRHRAGPPAEETEPTVTAAAAPVSIDEGAPPYALEATGLEESYPGKRSSSGFETDGIAFRAAVREWQQRFLAWSPEQQADALEKIGACSKQESMDKALQPLLQGQRDAAAEMARMRKELRMLRAQNTSLLTTQGSETLHRDDARHEEQHDGQPFAMETGPMEMHLLSGSLDSPSPRERTPDHQQQQQQQQQQAEREQAETPAAKKAAAKAAKAAAKAEAKAAKEQAKADAKAAKARAKEKAERAKGKGKSKSSNKAGGERLTSDGGEGGDARSGVRSGEADAAVTSGDDRKRARQPQSQPSQNQQQQQQPHQQQQQPHQGERARQPRADPRTKLQLREAQAKAARPGLGVEVDVVPGGKDGLLVTRVHEGTAFARAGVVPGDVLVSVNARQVYSRIDLMAAERAMVAKPVAITVVRARETLKLTAPADASEVPLQPRGRSTPRNGAQTGGPRPDALGVSLTPAGEGLLVTKVAADGAFALAGGRAGDFILGVGKKRTSTTEQVLAETLRFIGQPMPVRVRRGEKVLMLFPSVADPHAEQAPVDPAAAALAAAGLPDDSPLPLAMTTEVAQRRLRAADLKAFTADFGVEFSSAPGGPAGVLVTAVRGGSVFALAGVLVRDRLLAVDETTVSKDGDALRAIRLAEAEARNPRLLIQRQGSTVKARLPLNGDAKEESFGDAPPVREEDDDGAGYERGRDSDDQQGQQQQQRPSGVERRPAAASDAEWDGAPDDAIDASEEAGEADDARAGGKGDVCNWCGKTDDNLRSCAGCHQALYCSKKCQTDDWPHHQDVCEQ